MDKYAKKYAAGKEGLRGMEMSRQERMRKAALVVVSILLVVSLALLVMTRVDLNSRRDIEVMTMQKECDSAIEQAKSLSSNAATQSDGILSKIRANVHAIDAINQMKMTRDGLSDAYLPQATLTNLYSIIDGYYVTLNTGMSTTNELNDLTASLNALYDMIAQLN